MPRARIERAAWVLLVSAVFACTDVVRSDNILSRVLEGNESVSSLLKNDLPSVVLVYQPSDCFTCSTRLPEYLALQQAGRVNVVLLLARPLTPSERQRIAPLRLPIAGTLGNATRTNETWEFLVVEGKVTASAGSRRGESMGTVLSALRAKLDRTP